MVRRKTKMPRTLSTKADAKHGAGFRVAARTLLHLGRELITSDEIAINELIKNAFDAGSATVAIRLVCPVPTETLNTVTQSLRGKRGAAVSAIAAAWSSLMEGGADRALGPEVVAHVAEVKRRLDHAHGGDEAAAVLEELNFIEVTDAGCGMREADILPVFLTVGTDYKLVNKPPSGVNEYLGNKGIGRLAMMRLGERARVHTWVEGAAKATAVEFDWRAFDNATRRIDQIPITPRRVTIPGDSKSGTIIRVLALRSDWLPGGSSTEALRAFIRRLRTPFGKVRSFRMRISVNDQTPLAFPPMDEAVRRMADQHLTLEYTPQAVDDPGDPILKVTIRLSPDDPSADEQTRSARTVCKSLTGATVAKLKAIGPFTLHILRFNRRRLRQKAGPEWAVVRPELDLWAGGIAIYRDGFRVGFTGSERDGDWLGLDHKALRGGGYVVNRIQVVGALEITHRHNAGLIDLTNREGLVATPEAELLKELLGTYAINPLRALVEVNEQALKQQELEHLVNEGTSTLNDRLALAQQDVSTLKAGVPAGLRASVSSLDEHLHFITTQVAKFETAIEKASEGREDILELAGVGNVMHGVLHELTRTTAQTRRLMHDLAADADDKTKELIDKLEGEIRAINVRLRQLDPLLPGARQSKRLIEVEKLTRTIIDGYASRFERHGIDAAVEPVPKNGELKVRMVPGFLSLALENLISNAVYWIGQRDDATERGRIDVEIDVKAHTISVTDNGPGVSNSDRERIFLPGVSLRPNGKGYGLYLAREVAEYHGGRLYMDPHADVDGQLHTFVLELPGDKA